jgi:hypothetical protein
MTSSEYIQRPILDSKLVSQNEIFLADLLTMNVNDVVGIVMEAFVNWAKHLKLEEMDSFSETHLPKFTGVNSYEQFKFQRHRRFFMVVKYDDMLITCAIDNTAPRANLCGWREVSYGEAIDFAQKIQIWLNSLSVNDAFDAVLELALCWAERYNSRMGLEFALETGRTNIEEYTDENLTMFLRWCFHNDLELADAGFNWDTWADEMNLNKK